MALCPRTVLVKSSVRLSTPPPLSLEKVCLGLDKKYLSPARQFCTTPLREKGHLGLDKNIYLARGKWSPPPWTKTRLSSWVESLTKKCCLPLPTPPPLSEKRATGAWKKIFISRKENGHHPLHQKHDCHPG